MKRNRIILLILGLVMFYGAAQAQNDMSLYNMRFVHTRLNLNPALRPQAKLNIGIPGLSSVSAGFSNSGFAYDDLITRRADDSLKIDLNKMIGKLKTNNFLTFGLKVELFDVGFKAGAGYVRLHSQERFETRFSYSKDFMNFLVNGNGPTAGTNQKLNLGLDLMHYREYGLGYSHEINDQWTVGVTAKYLYGMENIQTASSDVNLLTDANTYQLNASTDILVNSSGFSYDSTSKTDPTKSGNTAKYLFGKKNTGFAMDLGVVYKPSKRFEISASLLDLGGITWKDDLYKYNTHNPNSTYGFGGISINQFLNDSSTLGDATKHALDSLKNTFKIDDGKSTTAYKTKLTRQMYVGANYFISEKTSVGALYHGQIYQSKLYSSIGLTAATALGRFANVGATYTVGNQSYSNLGVALALNLGPLQWHVMTDNLFALTNPLHAKNVHIRTGLYLTFGRKASDRDKDGITDFKDYCPDEPGLPQFYGCPDTDKDGIPNYNDSCPDAAGPEFWNGCPDSDNDSIIDKLDECPNDSGLKIFNGCPDTDGDGIPNKLDSCPMDSGLAKFQGCPDRDHDGIADKQDECPDQPGLPQFNGCPDTDKDSIPDKRDDCPEKAGPVKYNGCPDRDNDGVPDNKDDCPDTAGIARFNGCPDTDADGISDKFDPCPTVYGPAYALGCPDTDGDSIPDALDACPLVKGPKAMNGCPDTDGDGIADNFDKCPTVFGVAANNGCPELKKEEQEILTAAFENLEFAVGKDVIKPESFKSLNDLAALLKQKPTWKLQIDGHTDNVGNAQKNMLLSQKRANAVKRYLTSKGVAAPRLMAKGYGSTKPVADNSTPEGRDRNRRVEMTVIY